MRLLLILTLIGSCELLRNSVMAAEEVKSVPIVIAHRGASGYLPEHTLEAKAFAYAQGADYLEQDLVLTKDAVPIVMHDIHLDTVTDVAAKFPERKRDDGRYYAIDFTLEEIRTLLVHERRDLKTGKRVFPSRFPEQGGRFEISTFAEEIELVQGLNQSTGRRVGIYPEIKSPARHHEEGLDSAKIILDVLKKYGYRSHDDLVYVQCFDEAEVRRMRHELKTPLKLIFLIGKGPLTSERLEEIATFADGIGPSYKLLLEESNEAGQWKLNDVVSNAHQHGLAVHPYTFRADSFPEWADSFDQFQRLLLPDIDGVFTDFVDKARSALNTIPQ